MRRAHLIVNAGSSSLKFALYPVDGEETPLLTGKVEAVGAAAWRFKLAEGAGTVIAQAEERGQFTHAAALAHAFEALTREKLELAGAGHRIVHGGGVYAAPIVLTAETVARLTQFAPLAPQHQPHNLAAVAALAAAHPHVPQVACFDTAFHASQPQVATAFALPRAIAAKGVRRYGFHGLSYDYIAGALPAHLGAGADGRVIVAHLGHGASLCAMHGRRSVATTMGFTALDGLMMGSRSGAIDPGVLLHLIEQENMSAAAVSGMLYNQSGLLGVSGISDDMRDLLASPDPHAAEAVELFVYRIVREIGSLVAALGGLDALVFTAGIGEHAPAVRARVCARLGWLGVRLDDAANAGGGPRLSAPDSQVDVLTLATNEEVVIARACRALLA